MFGHPWFGCCEFTEENGKTPAPVESHFSVSKKWENSSSQVSQWKRFSGQRRQRKAKQRGRDRRWERALAVFVQSICDIIENVH